MTYKMAFEHGSINLLKKNCHACPLSSIKIIILTTISAVSTAMADDVFFFFVLALTSRKKYTSLINMYVYLIVQLYFVYCQSTSPHCFIICYILLYFNTHLQDWQRTKSKLWRRQNKPWKWLSMPLVEYQENSFYYRKLLLFVSSHY